MKQILLAAALILVPVAAFMGFNLYWFRTTASAASLGDLSPFETIISEVQTIAASGDLAAAETRITDFETSWDEAASTMRPLNTAAWANVDDAADAALAALRTGTPDAGEVASTLTTLMSELNDPASAPGGAETAAAAPVALDGIVLTDGNGRYLPCEDMLTTVRDAMTAAKLSDADRAGAESFQTKAIERCNADDDRHADEFSAQALAVLTH